MNAARPSEPEQPRPALSLQPIEARALALPTEQFTPLHTELEECRRLFEGRAWSEAYRRLVSLDSGATLKAPDLELMATLARILGKVADCRAALERAFRAYAKEGDQPGAARCAYWIATGLILDGDLARGSGWLARAQRMLDEAKRDCVEQGYLALARALRTAFEGNLADAYALFTAADEVGERFGDADLRALAWHGQGRALVHLGELTRGVTLLDESMAAVESRSTSLGVQGILYCSVLETCRDIFDLRRAREWSESFVQWSRQHELDSFRAECQLDHAEMLQHQGAWSSACTEAESVLSRLTLTSEPSPPSAGRAWYQLGDLRRLRGEYVGAEEAFRIASQAGRDPQPGLACLRLAQGKVDVALKAISRAFHEARLPSRKIRLLAAFVEVSLTANDVAGARAGVEATAEIRANFNSPYVNAVHAQAHGAILLAEGDASGAVVEFRRAFGLWRTLGLPYELARAREAIGLACRELGDTESAELELAAALGAFEELGARSDIERVAALTRPGSRQDELGLTAREIQVVRLVAVGKSNKEIANALGISQKTVARHMSNIFTKLDVTSRSAATAYAFKSGLMRS